MLDIDPIVYASGQLPTRTERRRHIRDAQVLASHCGLSVWDVGEVFRDPCHWQGQGFVPGPSVEDLVAALVAQKLRNATTPTDVTLAGYAGKYLEWSVPADMKSSSWTSFDACDLDSDGVHRDFLSWLGNGMGDRYEELPGPGRPVVGPRRQRAPAWSLTPPTHRTPPKVSGRNWSDSWTHTGSALTRRGPARHAATTGTFVLVAVKLSLAPT